ncbi:hypothetical protein BDY19DRAFT_44575 [Irpex rosettiformis]|uniref:Uncharacterized protein n=1 Tax=Irpex rosettiformis TaxID=378272 RepID=A0ACB8UKZ1_9APHY|nr:hypothetical protein BDY19DRAFT_44575 [Irpex rosettiformis]
MMDTDQDMNMFNTAVEDASVPPLQPLVQPQQVLEEPQGISLGAPSTSTPPVSQQQSSQSQDRFREVSVKVHVRRPERDSWAYIGRGVVTKEAFGQGSRIAVRALSTRKVITAFSEGAPLLAEKRGNFVVISCVDSGGVIAWSLNALNNSETLRLLAIIEVSCYSCKHTIMNPELLNSHRKRIARVIKDDRRKRHKRRKDQDAMIDAFARTGIDEPPAL